MAAYASFVRALPLFVRRTWPASHLNDERSVTQAQKQGMVTTILTILTPATGIKI